MAFWICVAMAVILIVLLMAAASRIRVRVRYSRSGELDDLVVIVRALYGAYRFRLEIPAIMLRGWNIFYERQSANQIAGQPTGRQREWEKAKGMLIRALKAGSPWRVLLKKVACTRFRLDLRAGTGDAPSTAVLSGLLWTLHGCAIGFTSHVTTLKTRPYGAVEPVYGSREFNIVWEADFQIRVWTFLKWLLKLGNLRQGLTIRNRLRGFSPPKTA